MVSIVDNEPSPIYGGDGAVASFLSLMAVLSLMVVSACSIRYPHHERDGAFAIAYSRVSDVIVEELVTS